MEEEKLSLSGLIEPEVEKRYIEMMKRLQLSTVESETCSLVSIAVSLRRIADYLTSKRDQ